MTDIAIFFYFIFDAYRVAFLFKLLFIRSLNIKKNYFFSMNEYESFYLILIFVLVILLQINNHQNLIIFYPLHHF